MLLTGGELKQAGSTKQGCKGDGVRRGAEKIEQNTRKQQGNA